MTTLTERETQRRYTPTVQRVADICPSRDDAQAHIVDRLTGRCLLCLALVTARLSDGSILIRKDV